MAVQIYQNEELNDLCFEAEALDSWKEIANELGMENQLRFVKNAESPIPYPNINRSMEVIFKTLCPTVVDFKQYAKTPIPLEVLKQISFSVKEKHFQKIQIWFDDKTPDPFAVGYTCQFYAYDSAYARMKDADKKDILFDSKEACQNYADTIGFKTQGVSEINENKYLIARWADMLRPINELKEMAKERLIEKFGAEIKITIENSTQALKKLQDNVTQYLNAEISEGQLKGTSNW